MTHTHIKKIYASMTNIYLMIFFSFSYLSVTNMRLIFLCILEKYFPSIFLTFISDKYFAHIFLFINDKYLSCVYFIHQ